LKDILYRSKGTPESTSAPSRRFIGKRGPRPSKLARLGDYKRIWARLSYPKKRLIVRRQARRETWQQKPEKNKKSNSAEKNKKINDIFSEDDYTQSLAT